VNISEIYDPWYTVHTSTKVWILFF
jgi:hypothetical protein